jgi:type VI secretion system protein ImpK
MLASQLPAIQLPSPEELRRRLTDVLDRMVASGRSVGLTDQDVAEARYAMVAFMDEQILRSEWVGRTEWMKQPLQLTFYREYTAGENFFARLRALLQAGGRPHAVEAYFLCLAMGFRGASGAHGERSSPAYYADTARELLSRAFPLSNQISPRARLRDQARPERRSKLPFILWLSFCVLLAAGTWSGLRWSIYRSIEQAVEQVPALEPSPDGAE